MECSITMVSAVIGVGNNNDESELPGAAEALMNVCIEQQRV